MLNKNLVEGAYLCTKDSDTFTNAIVAKIKDGIIFVITDFGNLLKFSEEAEFNKYYQVSKRWIEYKALDYPFDSVEDRVKMQIFKLQEVLEEFKTL